MIYIVENLFPIVAATVAGLLFGLVWWRVADCHPAERTRSRSLWAIASIAEFWLASILAGALILAPPEAQKWVMTVATPIVIWGGFVLPALLVSFGRRGASTKTIALEGGHWLGLMVLQAVVLQAIGLTLPAT